MAQDCIRRPDEPPIAELLDVDREYREERRTDTRSAPPILNVRRGSRRYTAFFSEAPDHEADARARNRVVLRIGGDLEQEYTVTTVQRGPLRGCRLVAGREGECVRHLAGRPQTYVGD